jgi:predicted regulator of Ras-like GTPase activity (Roadblock/LC7/MglB family)
MTPLLCSEFKILVQELLDGTPVDEANRRLVREHRRTCDSCCGFHDGLLGVTALAPEIDLPAEYTEAQSSRLWNQIVTSVEVVPGLDAPGHADGEAPPAKPVGPPISKLDVTKIDATDPTDARCFDLGKFLFDADDVSKFASVVDPQNQNTQIERVGQSTLDLLAKLQDLVFDLPTVVGTMVLSPDGSILDSRLARDRRNEQAKDDIGVWSLAAYHNAQAAGPAFGFNSVTQIVSRTESGYVIIANLEGLKLIVLIDGSEDDALNAVTRLGTVTKD